MKKRNQQEDMIYDLLAQLVRKVLPKETTKARRDLLFERSIAIISSAIGRRAATTTTTTSEETTEPSCDRIISEIKKSLALASGSNTTLALSFAELATRLQSSTLLHNPASILILLNSLSSPTSSATKSQSQQPNVSRDITSSALFEGLPIKVLQPAIIQDSSSTTAIIPQNNQTQIQEHHQRKTNQPLHQTPDIQLISDVVHSLQGIQTDSIRVFTSENKSNAVVSVVNSSAPRKKKDLAIRISEAGWLYRRISQNSEYFTSTNKSLGMVSLAFGTALKQELTEYDRLIAVLASQMNSTNITERLTLHRLLVLLDEPIRRLSLLAMISDIAKQSGSYGGSLCSIIHGFSRHGDPSVREIVDRLLLSVSKPLHELTIRWMCDGILNDTCNELFIEQQQQQQQQQQSTSYYWDSKYSLRIPMLPPYIPISLAQRILLVGKTVAFIRTQCFDNQWQMESDVVSLLSKPGIEYGQIDSLSFAVSRAEIVAGKHLLSLILGKFKLLQHVTALKRYLLLFQGDFSQSLIELLSRDLSQPSVTLMRHNLMPSLDSALRSSNAQFDNNEIIDRLDICLPESSPEKTGWETFSLAYSIDGPITAIFNQKTMDAYLSLFQTLWSIKRVEYELSNTWRLQTTTSRSLRTAKSKQPIIDSNDMLFVCTIRGEIAHVVSSVRHFIMDDIIEPEWNTFANSLTKANCLDDVIQSHFKFLEIASERALVTNPMNSKHKKSVKVRQLFGKLLEIALAFCSQQETFLKNIAQEIDRYQKIYDRKVELGQEDEEEVEEMDIESEFSIQLPIIRQKIQSVAKEFRSFETDLLQELFVHAQDEQSVRNLLLRLDFSGYHSQHSQH